MQYIAHPNTYEAWMARCALEKEEREFKKYEKPESRKRVYPFYDETRSTTLPPSSASRKTFVNLPTIPPINVLVDMEMSTVVVPEKKRFLPTSRTNFARQPMETCLCSSCHQQPSSFTSSFLTNLSSKDLLATPSHGLEPPLCPNISSAIRAIPTSQLLAVLENGQSVFRKAPSVPSFPLVLLKSIPKTGSLLCDQFPKTCGLISQHAPFRPLTGIPVLSNGGLVPNH